MPVRVIAGQNDLLTTNPELAREWHPSKNGTLLPSEVRAGTVRKIWWVCSKDSRHEWEATGSHRTLSHSGCPICSNLLVVPGLNDLETTHPDLAKEWNIEKNLPLQKSEVKAGTNKKIWWICSEGHEWQASGNTRTIGGRGNQGTGCPYCSGKRLEIGFNDLATKFPELLETWDPEANFPDTPQQISAALSHKHHWVCPEGHRWRSSVSARLKDIECPVCERKKILPGVNDLETLFPDIAAHWHPTKNGEILPSMVSPKSGIKYWWLCTEGHEWQTAPYMRHRGGCSVCGRRRVSPGFNDLETTHPVLAKEWHPELNGLLLPSQVIAGTPKKAWWLCSKGHEWEASIASRAKNAAGCGVCANRVVQTGMNDMATTHPELAASWHPTKNLPLTPDQVVANTEKSFWWLCDNSHEWKARGLNRVSGTNCPKCGKYGFDQTTIATLYFLENEVLGARKIGITTAENSRRLGAFQATGWAILALFEFDKGFDAKKVESKVLSWIRQDHGLPPFLGSQEMGSKGGWTETFSIDGVGNQEIFLRINEIIDSTPNVKVKLVESRFIY